jgi:hypothetical protein
MISGLSKDYEYQVGGSLSNYAPSYVVRQADYDLYEYLIKGEFCYVLTSRQMGKSSLKVRIKDKLQTRGFHCISLDLTRLGSENLSPLQWYKGIISELWRGFNLIGQINLKQWFNQVENLPPIQQLSLFIENIILEKISARIVIFIDEIDSVLSLDFPTNDFFALIRFFYNQRAENSEYDRLNFALFGVTTPSELISDRLRTPFNIGKKIELNGFTLTEVEPLLKGLKDKIDNPQAVMQEILYWTNGQPILTQKLCKLVLENNCLQNKINQANLKQDLVINNEKNSYLNKLFQEVLTNHSEIAVKIDNLVKLQIIDNWETQDQPIHLKTISDRLLNDKNKVEKLLIIYQNILKDRSVNINNSSEESELLLSGVVIKQNNKLMVKNKIYQAIFNQKWVKDNLEKIAPKKCINCNDICQYFLEDFIEKITYIEPEKIDKLIKIITEKYPEKVLQSMVDS